MILYPDDLLTIVLLFFQFFCTLAFSLNTPLLNGGDDGGGGC
ncbi:hypothetical protein HanRHA438_Chr15g0690091 [Helianthus annuus]|uniref:Uncharacterized protein n=1 Tax=Helianthus annuus TaxID=4232 RepID=A0A9K3H1K7_HELAN|nr:hypothetical protein HanXRQr2_Chr15g0677621 [Helianthus annuus]KAJ0450116.1 hypothetical protein HanHA300_Chr15g0552811 [Helianthus annuus]KAJ0471899.1 hypothetical protein HanHA89_Chr15g0601101 [Helianthus annuus]KAJ0647503.1 hypothetical protein HanLR1_Chr15g0562551 [Helianthus annuus]KAJ0651381.1 hypothetical protein HanOQP8_Chr15g0560361 [Helianthus annuus]